MMLDPNIHPQQINMISLKKIKPLYMPHITNVFYKRMDNTFNYLTIFDLLLPVEKHPQKDEYLLVGRYDCYHFILKYTKMTEAPCIIEDFTGKPLQYLKVLRRLHPKGDSTKQGKQMILNKLKSRSFYLLEIMKKTGFTKQDLSSYNYASTVPKKCINEHTTETTLNWIDSLKLDKEVKEFLYESAGLPLKNTDRLTDEKRKFLQYFFKHAKRFHELSTSQQIKVLTYAMNFKRITMQFLQEVIDKDLDAK